MGRQFDRSMRSLSVHFGYRCDFTFVTVRRQKKCGKVLPQAGKIQLLNVDCKHVASFLAGKRRARQGGMTCVQQATCHSSPQYGPTRPSDFALLKLLRKPNVAKCCYKMAKLSLLNVAVQHGLGIKVHPDVQI